MNKNMSKYPCYISPAPTFQSLLPLLFYSATLASPMRATLCFSKSCCYHRPVAARCLSTPQSTSPPALPMNGKGKPKMVIMVVKMLSTSSLGLLTGLMQPYLQPGSDVERASAQNCSLPCSLIVSQASVSLLLVYARICEAASGSL